MNHLDQLFSAVFERLACDAVYKPVDQEPLSIRLLEKVPDLAYTVGDSHMPHNMVIEQLTGEILSTQVPNPQIGDHIIINNQTYVIFQQPLRDPSQRTWRVHAIVRAS